MVDFLNARLLRDPFKLVEVADLGERGSSPIKVEYKSIVQRIYFCINF